MAEPVNTAEEAVKILVSEGMEEHEATRRVDIATNTGSGTLPSTSEIVTKARAVPAEDVEYIEKNEATAQPEAAQPEAPQQEGPANG